jgi:hypothetical protein
MELEMKSPSKIWVRNCPKCNRELVYKSKRWYYTNKKYNKMCRSCTRIVGNLLPPSRKGVVLSENHKCRISSAIKKRHETIVHPMLGKRHTPDAIDKIKLSSKGPCNGMYGKKHSISARKQMSKFRIGKCGPKMSDDGLRRLRIHRIEQISKSKFDGGQVMPSYNNVACDFFKKINEKFGWNGQYALNNGEYHIKHLGYFVDYYSPEHNLVIEWDEQYHYDIDGNLKIKDKLRQDAIQSYLGCNIIRIKEFDFDEETCLNIVYDNSKVST